MDMSIIYMDVQKAFNELSQKRLLMNVVLHGTEGKSLTGLGYWQSDRDWG